TRLTRTRTLSLARYWTSGSQTRWRSLLLRQASTKPRSSLNLREPLLLRNPSLSLASPDRLEARCPALQIRFAVTTSTFLRSCARRPIDLWHRPPPYCQGRCGISQRPFLCG